MIPRGSIVMIEWIDAHTTELAEIAPEAVSDELHYGYHTVSIGILVRSDATGVSLASDRQEGPDGSMHYRCAHFVPRGMIVSERVIREPARREPKAPGRKRKRKAAPPETPPAPT